MVGTVFGWLAAWTVCSVATALAFGQCLAASRRGYAHGASLLSGAGGIQGPREPELAL